MKQEQGRKRSMGMNVGSASLVMVFSVLCLTIFAVMSAATARSEWNLAKKSADTTTAYYAADSRAVEIFDIVSASYHGRFLVPEGIVATVEQIDGQECLSYRVPVDERQELCVLLRAEGGVVQVDYWAVENTGSWEPVGALNVWDGGL